MSKKENFINEVNDMIQQLNYEWKNEDSRLYWELFCREGDSGEKPLFTDNGKLTLRYMQEHPETEMWKAKDIAEGLFISSRTVSGSMRKLVTDGFVEKIGQNPVVYTLTESGKNIVIE